MRCTESQPAGRWPARRLARLSVLLMAAGCTSAPPPPSAPAPAPVAAAPQPPVSERDAKAAARPDPLPQPTRARDWNHYRLQAAARIVAANKAASYEGPVPEPLLAIPVLEIELNADGSVRRITVLRKPKQALDTVQLAIDAVHRAAPFGDVRHLPRPWRFSEVFLFNDDRRFKPSSLDL